VLIIGHNSYNIKENIPFYVRNKVLLAIFTELIYSLKASSKKDEAELKNPSRMWPASG
jgi:hypothetical protein